MSKLQTACGKHIYYEDYGTGDSALVLVHGWGMSVRTWDPILPALLDGTGFRVVMLDHRGCGQSDKDFDDLSIDAIAADVASLVKHLGLHAVVLNGWSLGGAVVVQAAANLGTACKALVLTAGATPVYTQKPDFLHGGTEDDMAGTLHAYTSNRVDFLQGLSQVVCTREVGANIENWFYQIFLQASPMAGTTLGELAQLDQRELLLSLDLPIISLFGSKDGFVAPPICRWVADHHPRAREVEFPGVGHAPFLEEREGYLKALIEFVGEAL
jgi:non-heme chloroperoxidase